MHQVHQAELLFRLEPVPCFPPLDATTVKPYDTPDAETVMTAESRPRRGANLMRTPILVIVAACIAFVLVQLWGWTAQFPWSSDPWLMAIPLVLVLAGLCSLGALVMLGLTRMKCKDDQLK